MDDSSVVSVGLPKGKLDAVVTRFTGSVRSMSVNHTGTMVAVSGE
jgi:hypothetical protein